MKKIGLSVYGMSIAQGGTEKQNLNDIIEGKGIIQILSEYIDNHLEKYTNDIGKERLFTFCKKEEETIRDASGRSAGKALCGLIKTGEYGTSSELVNINTGDVYNRTTDQADVMPFGFCIIVPEGNVQNGIIVMQTLGQFGIKLALHKKMQEIIQKIDADLFVSLGPVMPRQYVKKYFDEGVLQRISMTRFEIPQDESERYGVNYGVAQTKEERIIHKPVGFLTKKRIEVEEWMKWQRSSTDIIQIDGFEYDNLKFVFKLGNTEKTINLDNLDKIVITEDITNDVQISGGHPIFECLTPLMVKTGRSYLVGLGLVV